MGKAMAGEAPVNGKPHGPIGCHSRPRGAELHVPTLAFKANGAGGHGEGGGMGRHKTPLGTMGSHGKPSNDDRPPHLRPFIGAGCHRTP